MRELEHLIGRSVLKALGRQHPRPRILSLTALDLGLPGPGQTSIHWDDESTSLGAPAPTGLTLSALGLRQTVESIERRLIEQCLLKHHHNWTAAARELRMDRANLSRLAKRLGVAPPLQAVVPRGTGAA